MTIPQAIWELEKSARCIMMSKGRTELVKLAKHLAQQGATQVVPMKRSAKGAHYEWVT